MHCQQSSILIVDDEPVVCDLLREELGERGFVCTVAFDGCAALSKLMRQRFDLVLLDVKLPGMSGIDLLQKLRLHCPETMVIMATAVNDVDTAVKSMKLGAFDYVVKPLDLGRLDASIRMALEARAGTAQANGPWAVAQTTEVNVGAQEFPEMDAIAFGVEARYDSLMGLSKIVIEETAAIALGLDIPEPDVQRWVEMRKMLRLERKAVIEASLAKLRKNPLAQIILGMAVSCEYTESSDNTSN